MSPFAKADGQNVPWPADEIVPDEAAAAVAAAANALMQLYRFIEADVLDAARIHGDEATLAVMAKGKIATAGL